MKDQFFNPSEYPMPENYNPGEDEDISIVRTVDGHGGDVEKLTPGHHAMFFDGRDHY